MTKRKLFSVREDTSIDEGRTGYYNSSKRFHSSNCTSARALLASAILCYPSNGRCGTWELSQGLQELKMSNEWGKLFLSVSVCAELALLWMQLWSL